MTIDQRLKSLKADGRKALIPFAMGGYPNMQKFKSVLDLLLNYGDIVEVGLPFTDPVADGPTIQSAASTALRAGATTEKILNVVKECLARHPSGAVVVMTGFNQVLAKGAENFTASCRKVGVQGVIVPDLPLEESSEFRRYCGSAELDFIPLVAPTTPDERVQDIAETTTGFVYAVALRGTTGAREHYDQSTVQFIQRLRSKVQLPISVGFGLSSPKQVKALRDHVDGFVVASALINQIDATGSCETLLRELREACDAKACSETTHTP